MFLLRPSQSLKACLPVIFLWFWFNILLHSSVINATLWYKSIFWAATPSDLWVCPSTVVSTIVSILELQSINSNWRVDLSLAYFMLFLSFEFHNVLLDFHSSSCTSWLKSDWLTGKETKRKPFLPCVFLFLLVVDLGFNSLAPTRIDSSLWKLTLLCEK
jgi:hypothetical protein